ncbi:hypothetical protein ACKWTF_011244 [Chironomus riparius]
MVIDCTFKISNYSILPDIYICHAKAMFLLDADDTIQYVFLNHIQGKKSSDVTGLNLTNQALPTQTIPKKIRDHFPNLKVLDLKSSSINQISHDDISPLPALQILILWNNSIKTLDGNVFAQNINLIYIDFESNALTNTGTKLLAPLISLKYAYFQNNICTNSFANNDTAIEKFKVQLSSNCPPSFDMLIGEILENTIFLNKITSIITEQINAQPEG